MCVLDVRNSRRGKYTSIDVTNPMKLKLWLAIHVQSRALNLERDDKTNSVFKPASVEDIQTLIASTQSVFLLEPTNKFICL